MGVKVGVCGSPIWMSDVVSQNSPGGVVGFVCLIWGSLEVPAHDGRQGGVCFGEEGSQP